jgi:hypothetical protein
VRAVDRGGRRLADEAWRQHSADGGGGGGDVHLYVAALVANYFPNERVVRIRDTICPNPTTAPSMLLRRYTWYTHIYLWAGEGQSGTGGH